MIQNINVGLTSNNGLGDKLRNAMIIVNDNFIELQNNIDNISLSVTINDVVGLTTSLISLQSQIDSIESDIINISDVSGLTTSLFNITNDITTIENDILNLQNTDITTQGSINTINSTIYSINLSIININTTINDVITQLNSLVTPSKPYKVYTALLTQLGTDDPIANVLENTIGEINFIRDDVGAYKVISPAGLFTLNKVVFIIGERDGADANTTDGFMVTSMSENTETELKFFFNMIFGPGADNNMHSRFIEIRVYN